MVKIKVRKLNDSIKSIEIFGHAEFAQYGKDIVCAAISSISIGLLNAIDVLTVETCEVEMTDNHIRIIVLKSDDVTQTVLSVGIIQLKTIEERYPNNLKIEFTEV